MKPCSMDGHLGLDVLAHPLANCVYYVLAELLPAALVRESPFVYFFLGGGGLELAGGRLRVSVQATRHGLAKRRRGPPLLRPRLSLWPP